MPHSCSESDCIPCWLVKRNVIVFNIKLHLVWKDGCAHSKGEMSYPEYLSSEESHKVAELATEMFAGWSHCDKQLDEGDGFRKIEPFYSLGLMKLKEKDRFTFSFVTFPKPKARAPINQDPRVSSVTTALPPVAPEEGDDPSDTSE